MSWLDFLSKFNPDVPIINFVCDLTGNMLVDMVEVLLLVVEMVDGLAWVP